MKKLGLFLLCVVLMLTSNVTVYASEVDGMQEEMTYESDLLKRFGFSSGDVVAETVEDVSTTSSAPIVYAVDEELLLEGKALFDKFVETISFIEEDATWTNCLGLYDKLTRITFSEEYLQCVKGTSEDMLANMTPFEVLIYAETYLRFADIASAVNNVSANSYINNGEKGVNRFLNIVTGTWSGNNVEEVIAAYEEFLNWQIEYYRTYNFPYNFITGRSYAEETSSTYTAEPVKESEADITAEEIQEIMAELTTEDFKEIQEELVAEGILDENEAEEVVAAITEEKEPGIWDEVIENLKKSWFTFGLLVVLVVAYLVVRFIRTRRAIDEMTDEGK